MKDFTYKVAAVIMVDTFSVLNFSIKYACRYYFCLGVQMSRPSLYKLVVALALSILFTITLFYLTFDLPHILDRILHEYFPDVFWEAELREQTLSTLRPYGYLALGITLALIVLGFAAKRGYLAILGSVAMYLPTFGYFASAMFFLAGLGVLRTLWLPLLEISPTVLKLGCIAYLPFLLLELILEEHQIYGVVQLVATAITGLGLLIFTLGTATWLYGKFEKHEIVDFWIYKYSRHPQYLGFILWSYGLLIYVGYKDYIRGAFRVPPTLIWLVTTMIVIGVALHEEIEMKKKYGKEYEEYCRKTPFMIPLPKPIVNTITAPLKLLLKEHPRNMKDIVVTTVLYTVILITLSYMLILALKL